MTEYVAFQRITVAQNAPNRRFGPANVIQPQNQGQGSTPSPTSQQAFVATVSGSGAVSATVQPVVSNDSLDWVNYGDPVTVAGTASTDTPVLATWSLTGPFAFIGAYVTAISGAGASCDCRVSA